MIKCLLFFIATFFIFGCSTPYSDIPIIDKDDSIWRMPPGAYTDDVGVVHIEKNSRWSISDAELYRNSAYESCVSNTVKKDCCIYYSNTNVGLILLAVLILITCLWLNYKIKRLE